MDDVKAIWHVKIKLVYQQDPKGILENLVYTRASAFSCEERNEKPDTLWSISLHFPKPPPMWSGCMMMTHSELPHPGVSSKIFLPIINLTASDQTCVQSVLEYISDHARRHNISPILTFDQQLWWIASMIIDSTC